MLDAATKEFGPMGGGTNAAAAIGASSQLMMASDMADSKLSPAEYKKMQVVTFYHSPHPNIARIAMC